MHSTIYGIPGIYKIYTYRVTFMQDGKKVFTDLQDFTEGEAKESVAGWFNIPESDIISVDVLSFTEHSIY